MTLPSHPRLDARCRQGLALLGSEVAILCGAMTWVSERNLVAAVSNAGGFGVIACGAMQPERLREEILATRALTDRPFGVNLIVMHPELARLVDVCVETGTSHVVLAGGLPPGPAVKALKAGGVRVLAFAPSLAIAKKLVRGGIDGLVIEGMEAGGHIGPVATSVLAQEILPHVQDVPVFVAGGIGSGEMIAAYLAMGASGVQMGTRFVCAEESVAHAAFKRAFVRASSRDAQPSVQIDPAFKVIPVRALQNEGTRRFAEVQAEVIRRFRAGRVAQEAAQLEIEHFWAGALRRAVVDGDVEGGSLMAGQSVGFVKGVEPLATIMAGLVGAAEEALAGRDAPEATAGRAALAGAG